MKNFGQKLRDVIEETGLSQRDFAKRAGITQGTLARLFTYESEERCQPGTLHGIAAALNKTLAEFRAQISSPSAAKAARVERPAASASVLKRGLEGLPEVLSWFKDLPQDDRAIVMGGLGKYAELDERKGTAAKHG